MDESPAPFVVVVLRNGPRTSARIRDVRSQEQWFIDDAAPLHDLLVKPRPRGEIRSSTDEP